MSDLQNPNQSQMVQHWELAREIIGKLHYLSQEINRFIFTQKDSLDHYTVRLSHTCSGI